ncbi:MAG: hypothetical protein ACSHYF_06975 [Verrucomicrobiaceae bacterium]
MALPEKSFENVPRQLFLVRLIIAIALLSAIAISTTLWYSADRVYPVLPFGPFPTLPPWAEAFCLIGLFASLVGSLIPHKFQRLFAASTVLIFAFHTACDQTRWQPWVYQYLLMLIPFLWWNPASPSSGTLLLKTHRFILIGIYFWSGFHKIGPEFHGIWTESVAKPVLALLDDGGLKTFVTNLSRYIPYLEMGIALLLAIPRTRLFGIISATLMHLSLLVMIGPLMADRNEVIWPWNIAMIALVIVLFKSKTTTPFPFAWRRASIPAKATLALFAIIVGIMPSQWSKGLWDEYPSFHLYSGKSQRFVLILLPLGEKKLSPEQRQFLFSDPPRLSELNIDNWAFKELKVPSVSDDRVALQWMKALMETDFTDRDCFIHHDRPRSTTTGSNKYRPSQIRTMDSIPPLPPARK